MTFQEWRQSKRLVKVEGGHIWGYECADEETKECWVYEGNLVIECRPGGRFLLQLPMEEEITEEIEPLERRLYEFGVAEDVIA